MTVAGILRHEADIQGFDDRRRDTHFRIHDPVGDIINLREPFEALPDPGAPRELAFIALGKTHSGLGFVMMRRFLSNEQDTRLNAQRDIGCKLILRDSVNLAQTTVAKAKSRLVFRAENDVLKPLQVDEGARRA
jgi:hypothetical protein